VATAEARRGEDARQTTERRVADARRRAMRVLETYKDLQSAAFRYSPNTPYAQTRVLQRGRIEKRCAQCSDLTFEGESAGLSCASGKVVLPPFATTPIAVYCTVVWERCVIAVFPETYPEI